MSEDSDGRESFKGPKPTKRNPFVYLKRNGPSTAEELPNPPRIRAFGKGVQKFDMGTRGDGSTGPSGRTDPVYYIEDRHDKREVVRVWKETNPSIVERVSGWAFIQRSPKGFTDAVGEVFDYEHPTEGESYGDGSADNPCPFCDEEMKNFRYHRDDCEAL